MNTAGTSNEEQLLDCGYNRAYPCGQCVACAATAAKYGTTEFCPRVEPVDPRVRDCGYHRPEPCGKCVACTAPPVLECLEGPHGCEGEVAYRWPGYGDRGWPRCERHGEDRVRREQEAIGRYPDLGAPADFDPLAAGERWEED